MERKNAVPKVPPFSVQNDCWLLREMSPDVFEVVSKTKPSLKLSGVTGKELATLEGPLSELERHLREVKQ
jgi:hypothetical protein